MVQQHFQRPVRHPDAAQFVEQLVAHPHRFGILDDVPLTVLDDLPALVAVLVDIFLPLGYRERFLDHLHNWSRGVRSRSSRSSGASSAPPFTLSIARFCDASLVLTSCRTACWPSFRSPSMALRTDGICIAVIIWLKNR